MNRFLFTPIVICTMYLTMDCHAQWQPSGQISDLMAWEQYPVLRDQSSFHMLSSYDRSGGNDDGFSGTYSILRQDGDDAVIADIEGAGVITRLWVPDGPPPGNAPMALAGKRIQFYLDGEHDPRLDVLAEDLFDGKVEGFPKPFVGGDLIGGNYCHIPIGFKNGAKVVIADCKHLGFFQLQYTRINDPESVETFETQSNGQPLGKIKLAYEQCGDLSSFNLDDPVVQAVSINLQRNESQSVSLAKGPHTIRGIELTGSPANITKAMSARIQLFWDEAETAAIDLPMEWFFAQAGRENPYQSILAGQKENTCYLFFPMPYQRSARIKVLANNDFEVSLKITTLTATDLPNDHMKNKGYFHAIMREQLPTTPGHGFKLLNHNGRGHYVGVYMATEGPPADGENMSVWWEGDESFFRDGKRISQGTGSEDYFNAGWYATKGRLDHAEQFPFHGFTRYGISQERKRQVNAYRWHLPTETIPYHGSIQGQFQVGSDNHMSVDYRAAVFFYDTVPGKIVDAIKIEGELVKVIAHPAGKVEVQTSGKHAWSGERQLWWKEASEDSTLELEFEVPEAGKYEVDATLTQASDYGMFRIKINDEPAKKEFDQFIPSGVATRVVSLGEFELSEGTNKMSVTITGANEAAVKQYMFGLDQLRLLRKR